MATKLDKHAITSLISGKIKLNFLLISTCIKRFKSSEIFVRSVVPI